MRLALAGAALAALAAAQPYGPVGPLPGLNGPQPTMHSGYITVNATAGRALFFILVESAGSPSTDPVVFWTNGGPGCSSLGGGFFEEMGPFRPNQAGGLDLNPWSWHNAGANMLYVEQPAGVGFSYSNTTADYTVGDARAAADIVSFFQGFVQAFPQFSTQPIYISGESYGGHYVPSISRAIVEAKVANPALGINFQGFIVGNAWTWSELDNTGAVEQWYGHGMISNDTSVGILATCNMSSVGPLFRDQLRAGTLASAPGDAHQLREIAAGGIEVTSVGSALGFKPKHPVLGADGVWALPTYGGAAQDCNYWSNLATTEMGNVDIYDLTANTCVSGAGPAAAAAPRSLRRKAGAAKGKQPAAAAAAAVVAATGGVWPDSNNEAGCAASYDPCIDTPVAAYLNRADVQQALNVLPSLIPGGAWVGCSNLVQYSYSDLLSSMLPTYDYLLSTFPSGRYWVFSGAADGIVPHTGTRLWLSALGFPVETAFHPWNTPQGQVGGYAYSFRAPSGALLYYTTVRNAGHLVPMTQASRAIQMFSAFLAGQPL